MNKLILFLLFLFFNNSNCYIFKDVEGLNKILKSYYAYDGSCIISYSLFCIETQLGDDCSSLQFVPNSGQTLLYSNDTSSIYNLNFNMNIGERSISIDSQYNLTFNCYELDLNTISFKLFKKIFYTPFTTYFGISYTGIYEIIGAQPNISYGSINFECVDIPDCSFNFYTGDDKFILNFMGSIDSNIDVTLPIKIFIKTSQNNSTILELEPLLNNTNSIIYDIKTYPDIQYLNNMTLMGLGATAIIEFKTNSTLYYDSFIGNVNGVTKNTQYYSINGNSTSSTFLYSMSSYGLNNYSLISHNGKNLFQSETIQTNITQYPVQSLPNGLNKTTNFANIPVTSIEFSDNKRYDFPPIDITVLKKGSHTKFPFGYTFGDSNGYTFNFSIVKNQISYYSVYDLSLRSSVDKSGSIFVLESIETYNRSLSPYIYKIKVTHIEFDTYLYSISIKSYYGFRWVKILTDFIGYEALVQGNQYDGTLEFVKLSTFQPSIEIYDIYEGIAVFSSNTVLSYGAEILFYTTPTHIKSLDIFTIQNVSFLYNNIDVTNRRHYNIMYFNYTDIPRKSVFSMIPIGPGTYVPNFEYETPVELTLFQSTYNTTIQMFQIEFYVEANSQVGEFSFVFSANSLFLTNKLIDTKLIIKCDNVDSQGPLFKQIKKISNPISINNQFGLIGWSVTIEDPINGFDYGYIAIKGEQDQSIYNYTFNSNDVKSGGNQYIGEYDILFNITYPCISQQYIITDVVLYDKAKKVSTFSIFPINSDYIGVSNPFLYFLNDSSINKLELQCFNNSNILNDSTAPTLKSFSSSISTIDVGSLNRNVSFSFVSEDLESGLKNYQYPIVYLSAEANMLVECKSKIVEINETTATYTCNIELPMGFGYYNQKVILLSVYGFINNNGLFSGFSTNHLIDLDFPFFINTTFSSNVPIINNYLNITEKGGDLFIIGRLFDNNSTAFITFNDGSKSNIKAIFISTTTIKIPNVKPTKYPYQLFIKTLSSNTNNITITPIVYDYYINQIPEPTFPPTLTPVPTNAPQLCKGNPVCGGPTHGKCIENQGCVCYSPWIGNDCQSQIVIVDPPIFNNGSNNSSSPSIEIIVPENNGNNSSESGNNTNPVTYHSLISIVSLREINIRGDAINTITFKDDWLSKQIEDSTFLFYKEFETKINQETIKSNITATLKWFKNETIIKFAEEELKMYPSTLKYTIQISNYPFENKLNQLQIVMSALIQSNTTQDVCSSKEYGETSAGDNSNYLKIQIDKYSLYGRFIRRGIIDSNIRTITNIQLDSDMNPITQSKSLQSYIGIQIPYFNDLAIIDPDYSILVDSHSATSICSNNSKLSKAKIAGIIIGCVAFVSIIVISVIYHFVKKRKDKKFQKNINQKMKQMNTKDNSNL